MIIFLPINGITIVRFSWVALRRDLRLRRIRYNVVRCSRANVSVLGKNLVLVKWVVFQSKTVFLTGLVEVWFLLTGEM